MISPHTNNHFRDLGLEINIKSMKVFLTLLGLLILSSCSKEVSSERLVERNGFYYEVNSELPYTGSTEYYHENGQLGSKDNWKDGKPRRTF